MTAAETSSAMTSNCVNFVDKNDARSVLLALLEKIANAACTDTDEHFDEVGTRDREERNIRFTRDGFRKQGLTGSRRPHHQNALRNFPAELLKLLRVF
jgi:hypothetical protein